MKALAFLAIALPLLASAAELDFRVTLDGVPIGQHRFRVEKDGRETVVRSEARFAVRFLFVEAWRYEHRALERWRDDCVAAVESDTETNGERESVRARVQDGRLLVERGAAREVHGACEMTFAYWNRGILAARRLLNSQTGELTAVSVRSLGEEPFPLQGRTVSAARHRIEGRELAIDVWYSGGQWIGLESRVAGGRRLRYEIA